jgi:hypothetical protein
VTKAHRPRPFHLAILAPPRCSSRLFGAGRSTGGDNHKSLCNKKRGIPNALRGRKMSIDENSASESNETQSDDEVQGAGMPTSGFSFNFAYTLTFLPVLVHVKVEVKI